MTAGTPSDDAEPTVAAVEHDFTVPEDADLEDDAALADGGSVTGEVRDAP